jgi:hypothetical protein
VVSGTLSLGNARAALKDLLGYNSLPQPVCRKTPLDSTHTLFLCTYEIVFANAYRYQQLFSEKGIPYSQLHTITSQQLKVEQSYFFFFFLKSAQDLGMKMGHAMKVMKALKTISK